MFLKPCLEQNAGRFKTSSKSFSSKFFNCQNAVSFATQCPTSETVPTLRASFFAISTFYISSIAFFDGLQV